MFSRELRSNAIWEYVPHVLTPVARQLNRLMQKDAGTGDEFNAIMHVVEVIIKAETTISLAVLLASDPIDAGKIGYTLSSSDGLGIWPDALQKALNSLTVSGRPETLSVTRAFTEKLEKYKAPLVESARTIWSDLGENQFLFARSRLGLLQFLVALRNRDKHGATRADQYQAVNTPLIELLSWLIQSSPVVNGELLAPQKVKDGMYVCWLLRGETAQRQVLVPAKQIEESTNLHFRLDGVYYVVPDFMLYERAGDKCYFLNGRRKRSSGDAEYLEYATNEHKKYAPRSFSLEPLEKVSSATAGTESLDWDSTPINNLPVVDFTTYVPRPDIEIELQDLISSPAVNFMSLKGAGGVGKTTLTLRVVRKGLTDGRGIPFDFVIWFSARDTDLHEEHGPLPRERQVSSLYACARLFEKLLQPLYQREDPEKPIDFFARHLRGNSERYLLVFDNFESFDDTEQLQSFVKRYLAFPSKAIITSRESAFHGDVPIEVRGMTREQSRDLIMKTSRQAGCEPRITEAVVSAMYDMTLGNPYAIKLLVNEFARGTPLETLAQRRFSEDFLTALFRRSFERSDDDAQYLFLLISLAPLARHERFARLMCIGRAINYDDAKQRVLDAHLFDPPDDFREESIYRVSWAAQQFAQKILIGTRVRRDIDSDVALLAFFDESQLASASLARIHEFLSACKISVQAFDRERDARILGYIVDNVPEVATATALAHWEQRSLSQVDQRRFFRRAVELDQANVRIWLAWCQLESDAGDFKFALDLALRAVDIATDSEDIADAGRRIVTILSKHKDQVPVNRRVLYTESVIERLRADPDSLSANGYAVLARLALVSNQRGSRFWIKKGLERFSTSPELHDLATKTKLKAPLRSIKRNGRTR